MTEKKRVQGLFVKSPDTDGFYRVVSYQDGDGFVKCHGATVPLIDYLGREIKFMIQPLTSKPREGENG